MWITQEGITTEYSTFLTLEDVPDFRGCSWLLDHMSTFKECLINVLTLFTKNKKEFNISYHFKKMQKLGNKQMPSNIQCSCIWGCSWKNPGSPVKLSGVFLESSLLTQHSLRKNCLNISLVLRKSNYCKKVCKIKQ